MANRAPGERGAALLTVMVSVAVLTAVAVDLAYSSRVSLQIAANARDELRASWRARSGVSMSRLVLSFQQQLDDASKGATLPVPRVQLWRLVPVGPELVDGLFGGGRPAPAASAARAPAQSGKPAASAVVAAAAVKGGASSEAARPPTFEATIEDEGRKVNAQLDVLVKTGDLKGQQQVQALYQLVCDARWDPLFDREDARGVRSTREDLIVRLRDWVDEGEVSSALVAAAGSGATCSMIPGQPPFQDAFGDENQLYDRGDDRYRAKNARMDSLDELYLVSGIGDAFMAAFGDALTVYLPRDAKQNVNELDRSRLVVLARAVADPPGQPILFDPTFADRLQKAIFERTLGGILSFTPKDFGAMVELAGVRVNANLLNAANSPFTDRSTTFRIRANGSAGDVRSSIDAVVRMETAQAGQAVAVPGRIIHWREE